MRLIASVLFILLFLTGCITEKPHPENKEWEISPLFKSGSFTMIGQEAKVGFIYDDSEVVRFYPNKKQKYMWHFWGKAEELQGPLEVKATRKDTGEQITVLSAATIGGPNNGADAHIPSLMSLPSTGLWRLDTYIGEKIFGSIIVQVWEQKNGVNS